MATIQPINFARSDALVCSTWSARLGGGGRVRARKNKLANLIGLNTFWPLGNSLRSPAKKSVGSVGTAMALSGQGGGRSSHPRGPAFLTHVELLCPVAAGHCMRTRTTRRSSSPSRIGGAMCRTWRPTPSACTGPSGLCGPCPPRCACCHTAKPNLGPGPGLWGCGQGISGFERVVPLSLATRASVAANTMSHGGNVFNQHQFPCEGTVQSAPTEQGFRATLPRHNHRNPPLFARRLKYPVSQAKAQAGRKSHLCVVGSTNFCPNYAPIAPWIVDMLCR